MSSLLPDSPFTTQLRQISANAFIDEAELLFGLIAGLEHMQEMEPQVMDAASDLVRQLREQPGKGVEAFLHEYGLDTSEGVAIMCLAEALLRIPDAKTADRLIHGTFERARWEKHLGHSDSFFVNASSWGLLFTGKMVQLHDPQEKPGSLFARMVGKLGEPVIREALKQAMRFIGSQFVLGETIKDALANATSLTEKGYRLSYDMLGEGARNEAQAEAYFKAYCHAITKIGYQAQDRPLFSAPSLSIKLSGLHPRYQMLQSERVFSELLPIVKQILLLAKQHHISVSIDAEESARLDISLALFERLVSDRDFKDWHGIGFVVQTYNKRATHVIDLLAVLAQKHERIIPLRLVKGAYWDSEIKAAQIAGLPGFPVFTRKEHTDVSYLACANKILQASDCFFPQFATHNARTIASIEALAERYDVKPGMFEFQRLYGMGEKLHDIILGKHQCRIYAPVGRHEDLLAYLIRRLLENGANSSFVKLLMDQDTPLNELLEEPIAAALAHQCKPSSAIPTPIALYGDRKNSSGIDFGNLAMADELEEQIEGGSHHKYPAIHDMSSKELSAAALSAHKAFAAWQDMPVSKRSGVLEVFADRLEAARGEAISLLIHEAGKTVADALSEVREAADYARYYAKEARRLLEGQPLAGPTGERNELHLFPRGVFACISPWNFPLAIFSGQIIAALACGNCVIAKPAEQTPQIAAFAVKLLHEAGIPHSVLQLAQGAGDIGAALVADPRIDGVVFTGSVEVAKSIATTLAARPGPMIPLIAETGGQNCMVVDSSALLEQACDDILASAFGAAGQRCSALRVLYAQEDIADDLMALIAGAMQELRVGDPRDFANDIGCVIDKEAHDKLQKHITAMKAGAKLVASAPLLPNLPDNNYFIAPHAFEIENIKQLSGEVFGPVLHIIRFAASAHAQVVADINGTGYGLTFGIHSRIDDNIDYFTSRVRAGNIYVNRSMIGATVGVQPFGGEGLSGTGPKAGGPHYLLRFMTERTLSVNTAAIGGNTALLALET